MANANTIINDNMTLEEKLAAIDMAMEDARRSAREAAESRGEPVVEADPQDFLICEGCQ